MLLSADEDVSRKIEDLVRDPGVLEQAVRAVVEAVRHGHRIYVYGCGATGRLAKQMESSFWRPFWRRVKRQPCWEKLAGSIPADVEERLTGEMTGGDRALVSSLEGFEDIPLIGKLQLVDHGIECGDVVICVTEGGETSSVIGTILAALEQYGRLDEAQREAARSRLFFAYNNPDDLLRPFTRSASVLDNPAITRLNFTTGPQAITGSTRMQATTIVTFVVGIVLEEAIARIIRPHLAPHELAALGFGRDRTVSQRLRDFEGLKDAVDAAAPAIAKLTDLEAATYREDRHSTYFAKDALITVFIDNTERSPTFRLYPLDRAQDTERRCWLQVWTEGTDLREAWRNFLGRPFRGLDPALYGKPFSEQVADPYLREAALRSLANAGNDQEHFYDFSFSPRNVATRGPRPGDLGIAVLIENEVSELRDEGSDFQEFLSLVRQRGARLGVVIVGSESLSGRHEAMGGILRDGDAEVWVVLDLEEDPLTVRRQIALKMMLNAHSTAIMAILGRVVGNTMTNVNPSNLKLIGRATYLIQTHVNDALSKRRRAGKSSIPDPVTFAEANAVLFDAMEYVSSRGKGQTAEVALSIIRIVEAHDRHAAVNWDEAQQILDREGLAAFLSRHKA